MSTVERLEEMIAWYKFEVLSHDHSHDGDADHDHIPDDTSPDTTDDKHYNDENMQVFDATGRLILH